ncbi:TfoX/Sxy family protein [Gilvimarinus sp. F26214L]|uniref:TfoX/Sxy family protein n=1 Tax=Gilvimarinus sp. DZF01 TaxID=3461371 RepID=UPI004045FA07
MSEFTDHLQEIFGLFGPVSMRRMFGGAGIFHDGLMFALVTDDTLYLKADAECLGHFQERQLTPFTYQRQGKAVQLGYFQAPEEVLEDQEEAARWARRSYEAALRSRKTGK